MKKMIILLSFLISVFNLISQVPNYVPINGLVGWFPFNANTLDESGNGNHGVIIGGVTPSPDRFGTPNSSYNFTGNGHVQLPSINLPSFTINAWVKRLPNVTGVTVICKHYSSSTVNSSYLLFSQSANDGFCTPNVYYTSTTNIPASINANGSSWCDNNWHMLTGVLTSSFLKIYFDGVLINFQGGAVAKSTNFATLIGAQYSNSGVVSNQNFGQIDDVGFWNVALTDCEIRNLYQAGAPSVTIFNDLDQNCQQNAEPVISGIPVTLQPLNLVSVSNANGVASFNNLPDGNYTVTVDTTNNNWSVSCAPSQTLTVQNGVVNCVSFGMTNNNPCTDPDVSIYAPFLRRCMSNNVVYVQACNQNTATGALTASYVDVELDPLMTINNSSLPYTIQGNNVYRFQTGTLNPGQCVNFNITVTISCNAILGQTLCMDANLYPVQSCALDSIPSIPPTNPGQGGTLGGLPQPCNLPWDQSSLSVNGWCQNDSIYFTITNTGSPGGGDMECYAPVWITVNGVTTYTDSIMISGGQTVTYSFPGDGATWILNASQHPLHPGNSHPNAHVEGCGDTTNIVPGQVNQQPLDDSNPVVDIYCGTVTGSYDPNDKTGFPTGLSDQHYIQPNQQLQYVIRFQNTGNDTAFTVVIRDTLDTDLNIFTVTPGVSSHPYSFQMHGPRVLEWTFNNINLPDSTTDSAGSNGFVTFHVEQIPNLAPGTEIFNEASIYFDLNSPIITNTTVHRIYEGFVDVLNLQEINESIRQVLIYPNPTSGSITVNSKEAIYQEFIIYDEMGRIMMSGTLTGTETVVSLAGLSKGLYMLKVNGNYKPVYVIKF